jgi:hypothetical protein
MSKQFVQGHALIVGVGADLPYTVNDAVGLADILKDSERCGYPEEQVQLLTEENATRQHILAGLDRLVQVASDATVVIYLSGHGYALTSTFGKAYYLMPFNYDINRLYETAVSGQELTARLHAIPAQKLLLLLDCCQATGLDPIKAPIGIQMDKAPLPLEATTLLVQGNGRAVIASSQANELSYAGKPYSAFTLALIESLAGQGAAQQDGFVRLADLALHTQQIVPQRTRNRQHPILNFQRADNFIVAYYAGGKKAPKELPFVIKPEIEPEPGTFNRQAAPTYYATLKGSGAIAQGPGSTAVGERGITVGGNVGGNIITGHTDRNIGARTHIDKWVKKGLIGQEGPGVSPQLIVVRH